MPENGVVTVFCIDGKKENYVSRGSVRAWIRHQARLRDQGNGTRICDTFDVRIALGLLDEVKPGDLIFFGEADTAEIAQCRRVAAVRRNNFGRTPHWHIEAEYMYR